MTIPPAIDPAEHPVGERAGARATPRSTCVIGLQWGDEGKGKVVDLLAPEHDAVVRYNGGANAGHSIVIDGTRHAFHLVPSGVFHPGTESIIANGVVLDPAKLAHEVEHFGALGVDMSRLRVSDRAHVVMGYHKEQDEQRERALSSPGDGPDRSIGTTKRGIGPAYAEKIHRAGAVRVGDLRDPDGLRRRVRRALLVHRLAEPGEAEIERYAREALEAAAAFSFAITDTTWALHDLVARGKRLLFEGANATLLDVDHGTYPYVTSSNSSALGIPAGTGLPPRCIGPVVGIVKAYCTRVGAGAFPTEQDNATGDRIRTQGNEFGTTTGRPRRIGWLDLVALRYAVMINGVDSIALTLLDVLRGVGDIGVCVAYDIDGQRTDRFTPDARVLERVRPVYRTLEGFDEDISGARRMGELPAPARAYIDFIEQAIGVPASIVSVGADRSQTIVRE